MKTLLIALAAAVVLLVGIVAFRTARAVADPAPVAPAPAVAVAAGAAERLAAAVRIPTISHEDSAAFDAAPFAALHAHLERSFPRAHVALRRETIATHSLLYTWPGTDPSLDAVLLMGHMDVVPVEPGTEAQWTHDPFGGVVADGFVWGRGAIDNKSAVLGTLEAVEMLLAEGFRPTRTVYLAFGHDEEIGGTAGARAIAALLAQRGVRLELVLDEGGVIGSGVVPGVQPPVALVGIAEKGFVSVELSTRAAGGHSSVPPRESAIGILSAAVARVEQNPPAARFTEPARLLFQRVSPHLPIAQRAAFANLWLTRPLVLRQLSEAPGTNAMIRTTTAPTILQAGTKENLLPSHARAVINFRILPGEAIDDVLAHVRRTVGDGRVDVRLAGRFRSEPSPVSRTDSPAFAAIERAVRGVATDAVVAPFLVVVVSDSRYFTGLSENVFRLLPLRMAAEDLQRVHGTNERVAVRDYENAIRIYRELIRDAADPPPSP